MVREAEASSLGYESTATSHVLSTDNGRFEDFDGVAGYPC